MLYQIGDLLKGTREYRFANFIVWDLKQKGCEVAENALIDMQFDHSYLSSFTYQIKIVSVGANNKIREVSLRTFANNSFFASASTTASAG